MNTELQQLEIGLQALQLNLSEVMKNQLLNYLQLLLKWNHTYNLTAIRHYDEMLVKHVFDSLVVLPYLHGDRIIDVGTGAGLPGLILAIVHPELEFVLVDSNSKKIRFVKQVIMELSLSHVTTICTRIEQLQSEPFTTIISRAYSRLAQFYEQTVALATLETHWLAMKGIVPTDEIAELTDRVTIETVPLHVPQLNGTRTLCVMKKIGFEK